MGKRVPDRGNKGPEWGARLACYHSNYSKEASVTRRSEERVVEADDRGWEWGWGHKSGRSMVLQVGPAGSASPGNWLGKVHCPTPDIPNQRLGVYSRKLWFNKPSR